MALDEHTYLMYPLSDAYGNIPFDTSEDESHMSVTHTRMYAANKETLKSLVHREDHKYTTILVPEGIVISLVK